MNHPILVAALAEDRRRQCPCGAVDSAALRPVPRVPGSRGLATRDRTVEPPRRSTAGHAAGTAKARLFAWVASLLQIIGKGAES